jgi:methionyl-tRNA formyltransferase
MKVIILTSSLTGTAAHHLPFLIAAENIEVVKVVYSKGLIKDKKKYYARKLKKVIQIGILGTMNGIRMRKWYNENARLYIKTNPLEETCKQHGIPFIQVDRINCKETRIAFENANPDLGLSLGNGYIGSKIFNVPKYGMINIHHEILPAYQNAQSIIWQIYNGSKSTGYTIHKIDKNIDTGEILFQEEIPLTFRKDLADTVSFNYAKLWEHSARGLVSVLQKFEHYYNQAIPQGRGGHYTTPSTTEYFTILKQFKKIKNS